jgi:hypothetical protein
MGMYNLIEDNVNRFYEIAQNTIGECEHIDEFKNRMQQHEELLSGSSESEQIEDLYAEIWNEFWSEYA